MEQLHDLVVSDLKANPARCQALDSDDVFNTISWLAHESEWFYQTLPVIPGTRDAVARMRMSGNEVFFVTSPILTMRSWVYTRTQWLKKHFDATERDMVFTKSKHVVRGDVLVDDKPENVLEWAKTDQGVAYLLLKSYNSPEELGSKRWHTRHENIGFISSLDSVF